MQRPHFHKLAREEAHDTYFKSVPLKLKARAEFQFKESLTRFGKARYCDGLDVAIDALNKLELLDHKVEDILKLKSLVTFVKEELIYEKENIR